MTPNVQPIMHITMVMHNKDTAQHHVNTKPLFTTGSQDQTLTLGPLN